MSTHSVCLGQYWGVIIRWVLHENTHHSCSKALKLHVCHYRTHGEKVGIGRLFQWSKYEALRSSEIEITAVCSFDKLWLIVPQHTVKRIWKAISRNTLAEGHDFPGPIPVSVFCMETVRSKKKTCLLQNLSWKFTRNPFWEFSACLCHLRRWTFT